MLHVSDQPNTNEVHQLNRYRTMLKLILQVFIPYILIIIIIIIKHQFLRRHNMECNSRTPVFKVNGKERKKQSIRKSELSVGS